MELSTAAAVLSFVRKLEEDGDKFYRDLAKQDSGNADLYLTFALENEKNIKQVERVYYGVISDALDGTFSFKLDTESYQAGRSPVLKMDAVSGLAIAIETESKVRRFYFDSGEQSFSLLADFSRIFTVMSKKRESRISTLQTIQKETL